MVFSFQAKKPMTDHIDTRATAIQIQIQICCTVTIFDAVIVKTDNYSLKIGEKPNKAIKSP